MTLIEILANVACIIVTYVLIAALWRWLQVHGRSIASWLLSPFRAWIG